MLNFNDGLPAIIQPDHATIKSRDRNHPIVKIVKVNQLSFETRE